MGAGRHAVTGGELARDGCAADALGGLEHDDLASGLREIRSARQAVVAGTDDDDPVAVSHPASPRG